LSYPSDVRQETARRRENFLGDRFLAQSGPRFLKKIVGVEKGANPLLHLSVDRSADVILEVIEDFLRGFPVPFPGQLEEVFQFRDRCCLRQWSPLPKILACDFPSLDAKSGKTRLAEKKIWDSCPVPVADFIYY
jgi:hypothetical protein